MHPAMVPKRLGDRREFRASPTRSRIDADFAGSLLLVGPGAGAKPTASAVASDIVDIAAGFYPAAVRRPHRQAEAVSSAPSSGSTRAPITCASPPSTGPAPWPRSPSAWASATSRSKASSSAPAWRCRASARHKPARRRGHHHPRDNRGSDPQGAGSHRERRQGRRTSADDTNRKAVIGEPPADLAAANGEPNGPRPFGRKLMSTENDHAGLDRVLVLEVARVTEAAAIAAARWRGRARRRPPTRPPSKPCAGSSAGSISGAASSSAKARWTRRRCSTSARRSASATVREVDIAVDPLEGTTICAKAMPNALAV